MILAWTGTEGTLTLTLTFLQKACVCLIGVAPVVPEGKRNVCKVLISVCEKRDRIYKARLSFEVSGKPLKRVEMGSV